MSDDVGRVRDDYGEPWGVDYYPDGGVHRRLTHERSGRTLFQMVDGPAALFSPRRTWEEQERIRVRIVRCVNLLSGVPDAVLADPRAGAAVWAALMAVGREEPAPPASGGADCGLETPPKGRTKSQVLASRAGPGGGCCERYCELQACDCLTDADPD